MDALLKISKRLRGFINLPKTLRTLRWTQMRPLTGHSVFGSSAKIGHIFRPSLHSHRTIFQERSISRNVNYKLPDELWVILLIGTGGVVLYSVTHFKKKDLENLKKESHLHLKLAEAQVAKQQNNTELAFELLKESLEVIHKEIASQKVKGPPNHKALRYILDELANVSFEMGRWSEAERYFRLTMQDMLSGGIPKDDDAVIEISLRLAQCCAHQMKHELAVVGFKWCLATAEKKVQYSKGPSDNSKALLGVCLSGWGEYLLSTGQSRQAVQVLSRALQLSEEVLGPDHEQTSVLLNNMAKAYVDCENYNQAEHLARKAVEQASDSSDPNLPLFLTNLARILHVKGNVDKAKATLSQALELAKEAKDSDLAALIEGDLSKLYSI